jgi:hypothetical protein
MSGPRRKELRLIGDRIRAALAERRKSASGSAIWLGATVGLSAGLRDRDMRKEFAEPALLQETLKHTIRKGILNLAESLKCSANDAGGVVGRDPLPGRGSAAHCGTGCCT